MLEAMLPGNFDFVKITGHLIGVRRVSAKCHSTDRPEIGGNPAKRLLDHCCAAENVSPHE